MNRDIKFRIFANNKFYYKCLVGNTNDIEDEKWTCPVVWLDDRKEWVNCDNGIITQYTGLKDINNVEIYEGDICRGNSLGDDNELFIIKFGKYKTKNWINLYGICNTYQYGWYAEYIKDKSQVHLVSPNGIKVVGNIFENKELLKMK